MEKTEFYEPKDFWTRVNAGRGFDHAARAPALRAVPSMSISRGKALYKSIVLAVLDMEGFPARNGHRWKPKAARAA